MEWPRREMLNLCVSTNFDDSAASLLAETRTRRLHPAQSMAQGFYLRKDMLPAGVFLLILVGWAEEQERRSQKRHRKTIMLVSMQEIGTVTTPNIIRAKQATQKKACATFDARRGEHHEHHPSPAGGPAS